MRLLGINRWTKEVVRTEITIEIKDKKISVKFKSKEELPTTQNLFWALLADEDVRDLIREYQISDRVPFKLRRTTPIFGGPTQYWVLETGQEAKLIYEESTPENIKAYPYAYKKGKLEIEIGDFVELAAFLELTDDMDIQSLRKKAAVSYVYDCGADEEGYHFTPSKILQ